jgi:hypothetical protein
LKGTHNAAYHPIEGRLFIPKVVSNAASRLYSPRFATSLMVLGLGSGARATTLFAKWRATFLRDIWARSWKRSSRDNSSTGSSSNTPAAGAGDGEREIMTPSAALAWREEYVRPMRVPGAAPPAMGMGSALTLSASVKKAMMVRRMERDDLAKNMMTDVLVGCGNECGRFAWRESLVILHSSDDV